MKFKARIKLTEEQKVLYMMRYGNNSVNYQVPEWLEFEFSIKTLIEDVISVYDIHSETYDIDFNTSLLPWLLAGNQPEIVGIDAKNII